MTVFWKGCISKTLRAMNKSEAGCGPRLLTSTQAQEWLLRIRPMFLPELSPDWSADMEGGPRVFPETARKSDDIHRILKRLGAKKRVRDLKRPKVDIRYKEQQRQRRASGVLAHRSSDQSISGHILL